MLHRESTLAGEELATLTKTVQEVRALIYRSKQLKAICAADGEITEKIESGADQIRESINFLELPLSRRLVTTINDSFTEQVAPLCVKPETELQIAEVLATIRTHTHEKLNGKRFTKLLEAELLLSSYYGFIKFANPSYYHDLHEFRKQQQKTHIVACHCRAAHELLKRVLNEQEEVTEE